MLKPDQAKQALEKVKVEDWAERCLAAVAKLPRRLRALACAVLGRDVQGLEISDYTARNKIQEDAASDLDALPVSERLGVFATIFPKLSPHVEAAWQLKKRLPYEWGYDRKAFRAPHAPSITLKTRATWLECIREELEGHEPDIAWVAAWAAHIAEYHGVDSLSVLLAAAIDGGGKEGDAVFDILCDSARGEHEIGRMGRHVSGALLVASRPDGWEFMEKMLLAAQRQEGLRQVILETIDLAHPEAFRRMLRLILEHDLARFSATVRAMNVWFGYQWDSVSVRVVNEVIGQILNFLEDSDARDKALADDDAETVYQALWTLGFQDAVAAVKPAAKLLKDKNVERRFVAAQFLGQLDLPPARKELLGALEDEDLRVALVALEGVGREFEDDRLSQFMAVPGDRPRSDSDLFERMERLIDRLPEKRTHLEPIVWPWHVLAAHKQAAASDLVWCLGKRPPTRLIPHLPLIDTYGRASVVELLAKMKKWDADTRATLLRLVGDSGSAVREKAIEALTNCKITEAEAAELEILLKRKPEDLRRGVLTLLLNQKDEAALASADRLLVSSDLPQRFAGLEMLRQLAEAKRSPEECRAWAEQYRNDRLRLSEEESKRLEAILQADRPVWTLDNALGLMNPAQRTKPVPPRKLKVTFVTPAAIACLESLDELVHEHRETPINVGSQEHQQQELFGSVRQWYFPSPDPNKSPEEDAARLPLRGVWEQWFRDRPKALRDKDGLVLLRAMQAPSDGDGFKHAQKIAKKSAAWKEAIEALIGSLKPARMRYGELVAEVLEWLLWLHPPDGAVDYLLDAVETAFAYVPADELARVPDPETGKTQIGAKSPFSTLGWN